MEEAAQGDLLNAVRKFKRIAERQAAIWFRQLCDGVEYCHQRGIVHRDLKCENVLLDAKVHLFLLLITFIRDQADNDIHKCIQTEQNYIIIINQ